MPRVRAQRKREREREREREMAYNYVIIQISIAGNCSPRRREASHDFRDFSETPPVHPAPNGSPFAKTHPFAVTMFTPLANLGDPPSPSPPRGFSRRRASLSRDRAPCTDRRASSGARHGERAARASRSRRRVAGSIAAQREVRNDTPKSRPRDTSGADVMPRVYPESRTRHVRQMGVSRHAPTSRQVADTRRTAARRDASFVNSSDSQRKNSDWGIPFLFLLSLRWRMSRRDSAGSSETRCSTRVSRSLGTRPALIAFSGHPVQLDPADIWVAVMLIAYVVIFLGYYNYAMR